MAEKLYEPGKAPKGIYKGFIMDYELSDMQLVYRRGNWGNWNDVLSWLKQYGRGDNRLTPGETAGLIEDIRQLKNKKVPFTGNPKKAFELAHGIREEKYYAGTKK